MKGKRRGVDGMPFPLLVFDGEQQRMAYGAAAPTEGGGGTGRPRRKKGSGWASVGARG
jgi:hypothetical protein